MSDKDYADWQEFRRTASEAMLVADAKRAAGELAEWDIFVRRAVALEELATNFVKCANH